MEEIFQVQAYGVKFICDKSCVGEMLYTGKNDWSATHKPYQHKCTNCGDIKMFTEQYPLVRYKGI